MVSVTQELGFSFSLIIINYHLNSHIWLMASLLGSSSLEENHATGHKGVSLIGETSIYKSVDNVLVSFHVCLC